MKNRTMRYTLVQALYWMAICGSLGFASVFLLEMGYNNRQIGMIVAAGGVLAAVVQPGLAAFVDKTEGKLLKPTMYLLLAAAAVLSVVQLLLLEKRPMTVGLLFGLQIAVLQVVLPLMNSLATGEEPEQGRTNFGAARGMGSLAYAGISTLLGIWVMQWGAAAVAASIGVCAVLTIFAVAWFDYRPVAAKLPAKTAAAPQKGSFLLRYPRYAVTLVGCVLVYISHVAVNNYAFQVVTFKGWDSVVMGNAQAIAAISELPMMFGFTLLLKKRPASFWLRLCGIAFFMKPVCVLLSGQVLGYYGAQLWQFAGWAVISVASVIYVQQIMPPEDAVKGQSWFTMTYLAATVIASLAGGFLIDSIGVNAALIFGGSCAAVGSVILLFSVQKTEPKTAEQQ